MTPDQLKIAADTVWTLIAGFLVFWMNAGFGLVEAGLCRKKNATMILSKNFVVFAISTLGFFAVGFGLMFSDGGIVGTAGGWFLGGADNSPATGDAYQGIFSALSWTGVPLSRSSSSSWCSAGPPPRSSRAPSTSGPSTARSSSSR